MPLEELTLTLNGSQSYRISMIQRIDLRSRKDAFSIAPPGLAASENILLGLSGMEADITIQFRLHDDGTDKADGTAASTVTTIEEQIQYIEDVIHDPGFDAAWTLDHLTGNAFAGDEVFLEEFTTAVLDRESPKWRDATLSLRRGGSI
jgi:hypothetical protein